MGQNAPNSPDLAQYLTPGWLYRLGVLRATDETLRDAILANQRVIEALQLDINQIAPTEKQKGLADGQVAALKRQNASPVVELEEKLAKERRFRDGLKTTISELLASITDSLTNSDLRKLTADVDGNTFAAGKAEFELVRTLVDDLAKDVEALSEQMKHEMTEASAKIKAQLQNWVVREKETQQKTEDIRRDLERQNIKLDMAFIHKVTKDAADYQVRLTELRKSVPKKKEAVKERRRRLQATRSRASSNNPTLLQ